MTNHSKKITSEGHSTQKASDLSESDCQPKPSKRARPSPSAASPSTRSASEAGLGQQDHGAMATGRTRLASARAMGGQHVSPQRDASDRSHTFTVSASGEFRQTVGSDLEKETSITMMTLTGNGSEAMEVKSLSGNSGPPAPACPACSASLLLHCSHSPSRVLGEGLQGKETSSSCSSGMEVMTREKTQKTKSKKNSCLGKLDWVWSEEETSDACVHVLADSGAQVFFHQDYSCGTAAARGIQPMSEGQHFWEIKMDSPVYGTAMMVGIGTKQINLSQFTHTFCNMLGSDTNLESCGLSYTGRFYQGGVQGRPYCSKFGQGTVIGLHLDMWFGTLTYYMNGKCLGIASKGLLGKVWHPMVSSTAARSSMCLQTARSFPSTLQFWCCRTLRQAIPTEHNVLDVLGFPPGMRAFLEDNLMWLLDSHSRGDVDVLTKGTQTDLSMATHQLSEVPLIRRPSPDKGEEEKSASSS